jgi:hypothetical protein
MVVVLVAERRQLAEREAQQGEFARLLRYVAVVVFSARPQ